VRGCCGCELTEEDIAFECEDCLRGLAACFCVDCFSAGDHSGHCVRVMRCTEGGICDCGNMTVVRPGCSCPRHPGSHDDPPPPPEGAAFRSVFADLWAFVAEELPGSGAQAVVPWLVGFREWGDGYQRLIVDALQIQFVPIMDSMRTVATDDFDFFASQLSRIVTDVKFKRLCQAYFISHVAELVSEIGQKVDRFDDLLNVFGVQSLPFEPIALDVISHEGHFELLLESWLKVTLQVIAGGRHMFAFLSISLALFEPLRIIFGIPRVARVLCQRPVTRKVIFECLRATNGGFVFKRVANGPRREFDDDILKAVSRISDLLSELRLRFIFGLECLAAPPDFDGLDTFQFSGPIDDDSILFEILTEVKILALEWDAQHPVDDTNSLSGSWSPFHHLTDFLFELIALAVDFFKIPVDAVVRRLGIESFIPLVRRALTATAALSYTGTSAYARNEFSLVEGASWLFFGRDPWFNVGRWFSEFGLCLMNEADPGVFVSAAIESFGAAKWIASGGDVGEENVDAWLPALLTCRFFV
jgi:hypothetical protein